MPLRHHHPRGRQAARHPHPHALPPPRPLRGRRLPRLRGRGRGPAHAAGRLRLSRSPRRSRSTPTRARCARPAGTSSTCCSRTHYGECYSCFRNNNCELQALAKEYGVDFFRFGHPDKPRARGRPLQLLGRPRHEQVRPLPPLRAHLHRPAGSRRARGRRPRRQDATSRTFLDKPLGDVVCINCGQCINRCPTGALRANDPTDEVWAAIDDPKKHVVIQTAPSPRAGIGECFGLRARHAADLRDEHRPALLRLRQGLRHQLHRRPDHHRGRHRAAPAPLQGPGAEGRRVALPQFTSCSPGWVKYLEHFYPEILPNVSSAKSPQQMFGAVIKTYYAKLHKLDPKDIVTVALMPCSAKKFECNRPEMCDSGYKDVDYGLTTRELAQMIKEAGIDLPDLPKSRLRRPVRHGHRLRRHLRRHRRRDGSGPAHGHRAGHRHQGREPLRRTRDIMPGARLRGRASTPSCTIPKVGPVPRHPQAPRSRTGTG